MENPERAGGGGGRGGMGGGGGGRGMMGQGGVDHHVDGRGMAPGGARYGGRDVGNGGGRGDGMSGRGGGAGDMSGRGGGGGMGDGGYADRGAWGGGEGQGAGGGMSGLGVMRCVAVLRDWRVCVCCVDAMLRVGFLGRRLIFNTSIMVLVMVAGEKISCYCCCRRPLRCLFLVDLLMLELGSACCHLQIALYGAVGWSTLTDKLRCGGKQG